MPRSLTQVPKYSEKPKTMDNRVIYQDVANHIVQQQELIIGPMAIERAKHVNGLNIDWAQKKIEITGDPKTVIAELVEQYKILFGQISVEVCKEAAAPYMTNLAQDDIPAVLQ